MKILLDDLALQRTLKRMSHEIIEKTDIKEIVFVGIKKKGVPIAFELAKNILTFEGVNISVEEIDITGYRDDKKENLNNNKFKTSIENKVVILVDDVLQTGRTVRSAMDALVDLGRPKKIQLAVLVDRGHRELPIRADYVGKNVPTSVSEIVIYDVENKQVNIK